MPTNNARTNRPATTPEPLPQAWEHLVSRWLANLAEFTTPNMVTARRGHLRRLALENAATTPATLTTTELQTWLDGLDLADSTRRAIGRSVQGFYAWAILRSLVPDSPAEGLRLPLTRAQAAKAPALPSLAAVNNAAPATVKASAGEAAPVRRARRTGPVAKPLPEAWAEAIDAFDGYQRIQGKSPASRTTYYQHLATLARTIATPSPWDVTAAGLLEWYTARDLAPETRHSLRGTLRTFYTWALAAGHVEQSPARDIPRVKRPGPNPHPLPETALADALAHADARQRLILRTASEAGLRRAEIAGIHANHLLDSPHGPVLIVHGKGSKQRTVPLAPGLAHLLREATTADPDGWALPNGRGGHLTPERVARLVAPLIPAPYSLHALRHRFATTAYDAGRDLFAVQHLLGHASPTTTQRYVATGMEQLRAAVNAVALISQDTAAGRITYRAPKALA